MKKNSYLYFFVLSVVGLFCACVKDGHEMPVASDSRAELSVEEARVFFENQFSAIRTRSSRGYEMPFVLGNLVPDWTSAESSANERLSSVDIPVHGEYTYRVIRQDAAGRSYAVDASSKLIVVKSPRLDTLALYIRVCIPDEAYAALYDGSICNMTLNCENRVDYCGLEYYATLDGFPVAVARYADGKYVAGVFLFDSSLSESERGRRFAALFHSLWIVPSGKGPGTRAGGEWEYGQPGIPFVDSNGGWYIYVDTNGDGKGDAVTMLWNSGKFEDGGNGGVGGNPFGPGPSGPGVPPPGNPGGPGIPGDGSGSGSGSGDGNGNGNDDGDKPDSVGEGLKPPGCEVGPHIPFFPLDPLPFTPITPDIFPPKDDPGEPDKPKEHVPCFDADSTHVNPLLSMEIFGTKNNGKAGGRYGKGRGSQHNGIDLDAPVGTPVYAMYGGKVVGAVDKYDPELPYDRYKNVYVGVKETEYNAGNRVKIESDTPKGKILVKYFHLNSICVMEGVSVKRGQVIGSTGATGSACSPRSAGPHLHLEVYVNNCRVDPELYLYTQFDEQGNTVTKDCNE